MSTLYEGRGLYAEAREGEAVGEREEQRALHCHLARYLQVRGEGRGVSD